MDIRFDDKHVLVTGGTRGIGQSIARAFAELGADVLITGTKEDAPRWLDDAKGISYAQLEIGAPGWHRHFDDVLQARRSFDICINNAGVNKLSRIEALDHEELDRILSINLNAPIHIASQVAKQMIEHGYGRIINIASIFGSVSKSGRNPYTASKAGLIGATKTMAIDLGAHGILVNAVSPGFVDTKLTREVLGEAGMQEMQARIPLQRLAQVEDIVPMILFLCSDYNTYITGQDITIDGGFTLE